MKKPQCKCQVCQTLSEVTKLLKDIKDDKDRINLLVIVRDWLKGLLQDSECAISNLKAIEEHLILYNIQGEPEQLWFLRTFDNAVRDEQIEKAVHFDLRGK